MTSCRTLGIATPGQGTETGGVQDIAAETETAFLTVTIGLLPQTTTGLTMTKTCTLSEAHRKTDTLGTM